MASKRARKSKASPKGKLARKKPAAAQVPAARALHNVIRDLIHARQSGDDRARETAAAALKAFATGRAPAQLQQAAAEAQAVASNPDMGASVRLLGAVLAQLNAAS